MARGDVRILVAGEWRFEIYEQAAFQTFKTLGHETCRFSWHEYFKLSSDSGLSFFVETFYKKFQNKFIIGPIIRAINSDFIKAVNEYQPNVVFLYRGTHIKRNTLRAIKRNFPRTILLGYNNDDPFAEGYPHWLWRHFLASIPEYDIVLAYRYRNIADFVCAGAKQVHLLRSWFIQELHHPATLTLEEQKRFGCDVVFVGHYEPDGRLELLEEIVKNGFRLRLFGTGWDMVVRKSRILSNFYPVEAVRGNDYNKALCGAKVALCFLSKLNRDTYTRRCFEIPATKTVLLSEYSDDLATLYQEGIEADFFRTKEELIQKVKRYVEDDRFRQSVAEGGYCRLMRDGHDVVSRMKQVLEWVYQFKSDN